MLDFLLDAIKIVFWAGLALVGVLAPADLAESAWNRRRQSAAGPQRRRSASITPLRSLARVDLAAIPPAPALTRPRSKVASGSEPLSAEVKEAVAVRLSELIDALAAAQAALVADAPDALDRAASKLVFCHWISGSAWRRHLFELREFGMGAKIAAALADDVEPIAGELARRLAAHPAPVVSRHEGASALACAICGRDAVTFRASEQGLWCSTLSPINAGPECRGGIAARLTTLLDAGDGRAVLALLAGPNGPGCNAYCPECDRAYCKDHYAVETIWSGSWHEATNATCPLGHAREFE